MLIPIVARSELTVLLTQRTDGLAAPRRADRLSRADAWSRPTAIRSRRRCARRRRRSGSIPVFVEPLGYLDAYRTGTGFRIFPVVSLVREGFTLTLDAREVADAFEVPLAFLMDEDNHRTEARAWRGRSGAFMPCRSSSDTFGARLQV